MGKKTATTTATTKNAQHRNANVDREISYKITSEEMRIHTHTHTPYTGTTYNTFLKSFCEVQFTDEDDADRDNEMQNTWT